MNKLFEGYDLKIDKMNTTSPDGFEQNIEKLSELFPNIVTDGKIDFEKLKLILGDKVENSEERYQFTWNGKRDAIREASIPSSDTLIPDIESSKNWDTTENIYIEGDNLRALKVLQNSYAGKIKMIYIDPPYNTGEDFVYNDDFALSLDEVEIQEGLKDKKGVLKTQDRLEINRKGEARYHTRWLNNMYPRLSLARDLLTDDGVIFISIGEDEEANLKKICDEIFGEKNFIDVLKWKRKKQPSFLAKHTAKLMEYILIYAKNSNSLEKLSIEGLSDTTKKVINISNNEVERLFREGVRVKGIDNGVIKKGRYKIKTMDVEYLNDINIENGKTTNEVKVLSKFSVSQEKINNFIDENLLFITSQLGLRRDVSEEEMQKRKSITDLLLEDWGDNQESDKEFLDLFENKYFDYTKPLNLLSNLIKCNYTQDSIILDFFSGSATTAHAVMKLNNEDNGNRKFIMVQLDEKTDIDGFPTICEIGKERIRRAGEKIKEEFEKENQKITIEGKKEFTTDIGFKVFKIDSTNFKEWETSYDYLEKSIKQSAKGEYTTYKTDRTELDLVYEIMLKQNFVLTEKLDIINTSEGNIYKIANGITYIFLNKVTTSVVDKIIDLKKEVQAEYGLENPTIILNEAYIDTGIKTNAIQNFKSNGITNIITV